MSGTLPPHHLGERRFQRFADAVLEVVADVNLSDVFARVDDDLDRAVDWANILSLGEQQRIAFARLFLRKPKFAFLDEATSALDEENQGDLYHRIKDSGIGFISVGHRTTLIGYHDRLLNLERSGSWEIEDTAGSKKSAALEARTRC